jgi:HD-like signal output (HDOD) protein
MSLATLGRLLRLVWGQDAAPDPEHPSVPPDDLAFSQDVQAGELTSDAVGAYLAWLLGVDHGKPARVAVAPAALVQAADLEINSKGSCVRLLRRSPTVLPRLIRILRNETYSIAELASQIQQDTVLTAEVLRMARSALYAREPAAAIHVRQAVTILGSTGVEQVIARVVARPLYRSDGSSLQARAAERLWEESERCAIACAQLARREGVDGFDAYVAGLLQNAGWGALLRIFEIHGVEPVLTANVLLDPVHQRALLRRRDQLLARLIPAWELTAGLTAMASSLGSDLAGPELPLARVLRTAQEQVMHRRLADLAWQEQPLQDAARGHDFLATQPAI